MVYSAPLVGSLMYKYNVTFLTEGKCTGFRPHLAEVAVSDPVGSARCNAEPGFRDDPVVVKIRKDLAKAWKATVVMQSVVELK